MTYKVLTGEALVTLRRLGRFPLIITDPPYSLGANRREWRSGGAAFAALYEASRHLTENGTMLVFCGSSGRSFDSIRSSVPLPLARILSWHKPHTTCPAAGPFGWQSVLVLMFGKCGGASRAPDNVRADALRHRHQGTTDHPAELPPAVAGWLAQGLSDRLGPVLDPFCGTGTLLVPFLEMGFPVTGIEIDPKHAARAAARLRDVARARRRELSRSSRRQSSRVDGASRA